MDQMDPRFMMVIGKGQQFKRSKKKRVVMKVEAQVQEATLMIVKVRSSSKNLKDFCRSTRSLKKDQVKVRRDRSKVSHHNLDHLHHPHPCQQSQWLLKAQNQSNQKNRRIRKNHWQGMMLIVLANKRKIWERIRKEFDQIHQVVQA